MYGGPEGQVTTIITKHNIDGKIQKENMQKNKLKKGSEINCERNMHFYFHFYVIFTTIFLSEYLVDTIKNKNFSLSIFI